MPLDTRDKKRHQVQAVAEYAINEATEKSIKLNLPKDSIKSGDGQVKFIKCQLLDISLGGCAIDSEYILPPGVILDLNMDPAPFVAELGIQRKDPIKTIGKVTSCAMKASGHYRLGVFFTKIEKEDLALVDSLIKAKEKRQAPRVDMTQ